ncbi:dienelactone hydrolase family protein [Ideonella livida]|uniref:Dienelactone hydrolase family protein n=1 Tax=Ideonella livida TaxID=2707176 RepID=A0A7C9PGC3_9BURK|nr:dienelactone hydrolase family protein [Ideonella livida]NDY91196.1 dienelactone hydrolase family protein [Ideonella livida]
MGSLIPFTRPDGQTAQGWLETPAGDSASAPGLVVIQEWWGLNDQIKGVAHRYAEAGYRVLVPDLYRGRCTLDAQEAEHLMTGLDFADAASQDVRGALQWLQAGGSPRVGVTGYCMGGALTLLSTVFCPEADAAAAWYGFPPLAYLDPARIRAPLLGHFATQDAYFPVAQVAELEALMAQAGVRFECHRYEAKHAFANELAVPPHCPPTNAYDPAAAALAWDRTLDFLGRHLATADR